MNLSVIIINYNNSYNLKNCLESLLSQSYDRNLFKAEMIIVDSGSTDNSLNILNKYENKFKIIYSRERLTPAEARNLGVNNSTGDILIFSDSDCYFTPEWFEKYALYFSKRHQIDCICGTRFPDAGGGAGAFNRRYNFILYSRKFRIYKQILINKETIKKGAPLILIAANNFAIKREPWKKIGGMKICFRRPAGEDVLMQMELIMQGYNILFAPDIKISHNHPISFSQLMKKAFYQGGSLYFINKHSERYIKWKHFLQVKHFLKNIIISILFISLLFIVFLGTPFSFSTKTLFFAIFFSWVVMGRIEYLKLRLNLVLEYHNEDVRKNYDLSYFKLFYFDTIDFFAKFSRLIGFLFYHIKYYKNADTPRSNLEKQ